MSNTKDRLRAHLEALVGERHPFSSPHHLLHVQTYLSAQFRAFGLAVELHPFEVWGQTYHNVVATLPAQKQPPLIIAAHYDTVEQSPGADDNASGLAVLLETARALCRTPRRRPIRFIAFCLEEEDLLGSRAYVALLEKTRQSILGVIVLECVGYTRSEAGSQRTPPHLPISIPSIGDFLGVVGNEASRHLVTAIISCGRATVPSLKMIPLTVPGKGDLLPDTRRSDHAAFWDQGYPAVMLTDTANYRNPHYHQPSDTIETLDLDFLSHMVPLLVEVVTRLAENS
ncbi:MAG: M20/M25/M40 family metallo-hydrolase [Nitrospiraceae bacterium]